MDTVAFLADFILHIDAHLFELVAEYGVGIYAILFLIVFCETGLVVTPFLPGDSLLFASGVVAGAGLMGYEYVLLTLLDNLGFTDNYMECMIPTVGVYPIATANDKSQISAPLMSRFAVIELPDYTPEEKKIIFSQFALPKVLKRLGLHDGECIVTEDGLDAVIEMHKNTSGIRDLEQAAEHMAANALYQIEVGKVPSVTFDAEQVYALLSH